MRYFTAISLTLLLCLSLARALPPMPASADSVGLAPGGTAVVDHDTYIDGNAILMFVTNTGGFGRDYSGTFGRDYGTFFPYVGADEITAGRLTTSPLYGAGLWLGGLVNGNIRMAIHEYASEYVPGPMAGGTFQSDRPEFRVYKLYRDSLADNPNQDYLDWPVAQGAPVDSLGQPAMRGSQMTWSVFNDADPTRHIGQTDAGETDPMKVEVAHTVWTDTGGFAVPYVSRNEVPVNQVGNTNVDVRVYASDPMQLTGRDYCIVFDSNAAAGLHWNVIDLTLGAEVLSEQTDFSGAVTASVDGLDIHLAGAPMTFTEFSVVANGGGELDPPLPGALASAGFPTPGSLDPDGNQQLGSGRWALHAMDRLLGGNSPQGSFGAFVNTVTYISSLTEQTEPYLFEMRFTGSNSHPGVGGGYVRSVWDPLWVPFELWRSPASTPDDRSDDVRLMARVYYDMHEFELQSWGSRDIGNCVNACEHSASPDYDDPTTAYVSWYLPADATPGESGYRDCEAELLAGTYFPEGCFTNYQLFRTLLINVDAGESPPFGQTCPEQGTVFRFGVHYPAPPDTFYFTAPGQPLIDTVYQSEDLVIYQEYQLINKSGQAIDSCFVSLWSDPDVGWANDDLMGCDPEDSIWYCYSTEGYDQYYGNVVPALGFKLLRGPAFAGEAPPQPYAINMFINGTDPDSKVETFRYMTGLDGKTGLPYTYGGEATRYVYAGDPVTGLGDVDTDPRDKRILTSVGPFTFFPGDTQVVRFKMAVGPGATRAEALNTLREILAFDPEAPLAASAVAEGDYVPPIPKMPVNVVVGQLANHDASDIEVGTLRLNGTLEPEATQLLTSHPAMPGEVLHLTYRAQRLFELFGPTEPMQTEAMTIEFATADGQAYIADGSLTFQVILIGDVNGDAVRNLTDLTLLVRHLFANGAELRYPSAADADCDGVVTLTDVTQLVNALFMGGALLDFCEE